MNKNDFLQILCLMIVALLLAFIVSKLCFGQAVFPTKTATAVPTQTPTPVSIWSNSMANCKSCKKIVLYTIKQELANDPAGVGYKTAPNATAQAALLNGRINSILNFGTPVQVSAADVTTAAALKP